MPWRFGRELPLSPRAGDQAGLQWHMARNNSFVPGRLLAVYLLLCVVSLGIGAAFWWFGAPAVLPLAGIELAVLGLAFWLGARHAGDAEVLTLADREMRVEHRCGRLVERALFRAEWLRIEPSAGEGSLVELSGQGQRVRVGRYLRPELRAALARELRQAVRRECTRPMAQDTQLELQR